MSEQADVLNRFLEELHRRECRFKIPMEVVSDIKTSVEELVYSLSAEVGKIDPLFEVSSVLKRGSFYEDTRIRVPDEFDFLVILGEFSKPGVVRVESVCENSPGLTHVIAMSSDLAKYAKDDPNKDCGTVIYARVPSLKDSLSPAKVSSRFRRLMDEASLRLCSGFHASNSHKIEKMSGNMVYNKPNFRLSSGPNACLELQWTTREPEDEQFRTFPITVDVTPAISFQSGVITTAEQSGTRQIFAIPGLPGSKTNCEFELCWRVSYSNLECAKMEAMSETHKACYRLLKYISRGGGTGSYSLRSLNSYMLKMAVFHHSDECLKEDLLRHCIESILRLLYRRTEEGFLPHYFSAEKNVWARNLKKETVTPKKIVRDIMSRLDGIARISSDDYVFLDLASKIRKYREYFGDMENEEFTVKYSSDPFSGISHATSGEANPK